MDRGIQPLRNHHDTVGKAMRRQWYLVCYDIRDPKRLRKTARILTGYGTRIQFSVFRLQSTPKQIERLRWEMAQVLEDEDHFMIAGLCSRCANEVIVDRGTPAWEPEPPNFVIIGGENKD